MERLTATMPAQGAPAIVHGDYRLTNVIYRRDVSGIAAVVDWEMATLATPSPMSGCCASTTGSPPSATASCPP